jgi:hypothetical protein
MAISGQTPPQEFSLYRYRKGKSDPEHGKWSKRQDQGGPNKRTMQRRFAPPWPYRVGSGVNWFGNDRFWTLLPANVTWGRGEKTFWFRQEWGYYGRGHGIPEKDAGKLTVTARRLDGPAPPAAILKANSSYREQGLEGLPSRGN